MSRSFMSFESDTPAWQRICLDSHLLCRTSYHMLCFATENVPLSLVTVASHCTSSGRDPGAAPRCQSFLYVMYECEMPLESLLA